jgi:hypothetical protein
LLTHDEGAVPTDDEYAEWRERFPDRSTRQLRDMVRTQRDVLKQKAAEREQKAAEERNLTVRAPRLSACPA